MSIRLCIGDYAKKGYEPENMGCRVYSLEELCYFIRENAGLLDDQFVSEELIQWLRLECGLAELAQELEKAGKKNPSLKGFVEILLQYSCFFSKEENRQILLTISDNDRLSIYERRKAKADALVEKKEYGLAGREYAGLLRQLPPTEQKLRGEIYHGCGVCLARLFYFELAGSYFSRAYQLTGKPDSYRQYLWTKRLALTEAEYEDYLGEHGEAYEDSLLVEKELDTLLGGWEESHYGRLLEELRGEDREKKLMERIDYLKDEYRQMTDRMRG